MRKDKIRAYELRRQNKSYSEITQALKIPKSTLASWFKDQEWSKDIGNSLVKKYSFISPQRSKAAQRSNKLRWTKAHQSYRDAAEAAYTPLSSNPLFIAGVMLYWGEGEKTAKQSRVKLSNNDPSMIRLFYAFLKDVLLVPSHKIYVWLLLYPDLKDDMQKIFWHKATGIPLSQFKKSIYITGRHPAKRLSYGVCNIFVQSRELKEKMMTWIGLCQSSLLKQGS